MTLKFGILFMIMFRIFWNRCSHGPWPIFTKLPCSKWRLLYIRIEWSWLVEANCTHTPTKKKNFQSFYKKTIDLVCDWFLRQCKVGSRHLNLQRTSKRFKLSGVKNKGPVKKERKKKTKKKKKRKRKRFRHISTFVVLFI